MSIRARGRACVESKG